MSKDYLTSVHLYECMIHSSPCCQWALTPWPLTIHACQQHDVATWGQSADSNPWHPLHSWPLTHYKRGCLPGQRFPCCLTAVQLKKPPGPVDMGIKRDNKGTDWEATLENNTSCGIGSVYWQITILGLPEVFSLSGYFQLTFILHLWRIICVSCALLLSAVRKIYHYITFYNGLYWCLPLLVTWGI